MASAAADSLRGALILRVILRHGRPCLQEQHQELEVVPRPRHFQQLQEELAPSLLRLHVLHPHLGGGGREGGRERGKEGESNQLALMKSSAPPHISHPMASTWRRTPEGAAPAEPERQE